MCVVRLTGVDQRQHHKDEGLQGDDQDVEQRPHGTGDDMA
jgi:hypothetical protein